MLSIPVVRPAHRATERKETRLRFPRKVDKRKTKIPALLKLPCTIRYRVVCSFRCKGCYSLFDLLLCCEPLPGSVRLCSRPPSSPPRLPRSGIPELPAVALAPVAP